MHIKEQKGQFFSDKLINEIRNQIAMVDKDNVGKRIYFENAGGALTLKKVCKVACTINKIPDFHNRPTPGAQHLMKLVNDGITDAMLTFGAKSGSILCDLTVSKSIFTMTGVIMQNVPGSNVVTTDLEHPATHDACKYHAKQLNKELRVSGINSETGVIDIDDMLSKIDQDTCMLSIIHSSNILGTLNDVELIIKEARKIKPDLYILLDSTQHVPHDTIDVEALQVDAAGFAPYKILGKRGLGVGWVSDRVATMPHPHFLDGAADNWDLGGYEPAGLASLTLVNDYICWIGSKFTDVIDRRELLIAGMEAIKMHERALMYRLFHGSEELPGVNDLDGAHIYFMDDFTKRDCILPLSFDNIEAVDAVKKYVDNGIYVFHRSRSNKMSRRVLDGANIPSIVRVSPMHYNTKEEVDEFLRVTASIANGKL